MKKLTLLVCLSLCTIGLMAQEENPAYYGQALTLGDCRQMAVEWSKALQQARTREEMAGYDRKVALSYYFPKVTAAGTYLYNNRDVALVSSEQSARLQNMGTSLENALWDEANRQVNLIENQYVREIAKIAVQKMYENPNRTDIATPVNAIGEEIDKALHPDMHHLLGGTVMVEQPIFAGGKIIYSNQMASLAKDLSESQYEMKEAEILLDVDQAYWQIISIANKKKLAESYSDLLHQIQKDVESAVSAGVSTEADVLQVKVKANEADMMLTKASNGLTLSKMLLCQRIGLPLNTPIVLADENLEVIPVPGKPAYKSLEDIYASRPETRSLSLATKIYDKKAKVARADYLPTVAAIAAYTVNNPNLYNGFQNIWQGGNLTAGVLVKIPIFHAGEGYFKYQKAKAEKKLYQQQLSDARELIELQVTQQRKLFDEAGEKLKMASSNVDAAEENLRSATLGFEAGVIPTNTVLAAHTAWLSAHSELIDAGIELQMAAASLKKAEGNNN